MSADNDDFSEMSDDHLRAMIASGGAFTPRATRLSMARELLELRAARGAPVLASTRFTPESAVRHVVRGTTYVPVSREVRAQCSTGAIQDDELLVLYVDVSSGHMSVRRPSEFDDGRFEAVETDRNDA